MYFDCILINLIDISFKYKAISFIRMDLFLSVIFMDISIIVIDIHGYVF